MLENDELSRERDELAREKNLSEQLEAMRRPAAEDESSAAVAGELRVAPGQSIMAAVERALPGQTIRLAPGVYNEQVVLDKEVHIIGPRGAVLDSQRSPTLRLTGPAAPSVRGITIRCRGLGPLRIRCEGHDDVTIDCFSKYAVWIEGGSRALVEGCDISSGDGVAVCGQGTAPTLRGNAVHDCGEAVFLFGDAARGVVEGNDVRGSAAASFAIDGGADPVVRGNRVRGHRGGVHVSATGRGTVEGNAFERIALASYAPGGGVLIEEGGAAVVRGNTSRA
eukprot:tig00001222_g7606.t1